jgi:Zn-dependent metalloprotease
MGEWPIFAPNYFAMRLFIFCILAMFFSVPLVATERIIKDASADRLVPGALCIRYTEASSLPNYIQFRKGEGIPFEELRVWAQRQFQLHPDITWLELNRNTDGLGMLHIRLQQLYQGRPVVGTMLNVHTRMGQIESLSGVWVSQISLIPNSNSFTEPVCFAQALQSVGATQYKWQLPSEEAFIKKETGNPNATFFPVAETKILKIENTFYDCFVYDIYATEPLARKLVYVDRATGQVVLSRNLIQDITTSATAVTKYSGTVTMQTDSLSPTSFRLRDASRGLGVQTYDMNNGTNYGSSVDFTDADNYWNNNNAQQDHAAADAHWGAQNTYDYLSVKHGRNSIDNAGFLLRSYVHYNTNYVNAFWDGTRMTYGDGNGTSYLIFTGLDVCGHEIGHGLVNYSCDLSATSSGTQECDALNEAYADCIGAAVERYARPTQWDWNLGGDITATAGVPNGNGLRLMSDPTAMGDPKCYQGTNWNTSGEPHANAGPLDYWFYTMVAGNSANSITGLGFDVADSIMYRTLTVHLFPNADYADARFYSIISSTELYGGCSLQTITTTNAWNLACVGAAYVPGPADALFIANVEQTCDTTLTVQFQNNSLNMNSCMWYFGDGNTSTQFNPTHTYSAGNYTVKLVIDGGTCGADSLVMNNFIQVGPPAGPSVIGDTLCGSGIASLSATPFNSGDTIRWYTTATGGTPIGTGNTFTTPLLSTTTTYYAEEQVDAPEYHIGPLNNSIGNGGNYTPTTRFLVFNCTSPTILKSVWVMASGAGNRTIILKNSGGMTIQSVTVNIPNGGSVVTLNMPIPVGNGMQIGLASTSNVNLYRNSTGAVYPYSNGPITITGNTAANSATYYYFFYDWVVQADPCISTRTPAVALVNSGTLPTPATVSPAGPLTICSGASTTLSATSGAGYLYQWYLNGSPLSGATASNYVPIASGSYYCMVSNPSGCFLPGTSNTVVVTIGTTPNASITPNTSQTVCTGNTVILTASSGVGYSYQWYNNGSLITGATSSSYTASISGTYSVTVTNSSGCTATSSGTAVLVVPAPTGTTISPAGPVAICQGSSVSLSTATTSGYTYQWLQNGSVLVGSTTATYATNTSGNFALVVANTFGCKDTSNVVVVTVNPLPVAVITASSTSFCAGDSTTLTASSGTGYQYQWYMNGSAISGATAQTLTVNQAGNYGVIITDGNGCTSSAVPIAITVIPLPTPTILNTNGTLSVTGGPYDTYQWYQGGVSIPGATNATYTPGVNGSYSVEVSLNGCRGTATFTMSTVGVNDVLTESIRITPNPFTDKITVDGVGNFELRLLDVTGQILLVNKQTQILNTSHLATGVYFIQVWFEGRIARSEKVVKW